MIPDFRLNSALTRAWAINREVRHKLAAWFAFNFRRTGVAVVTDRLFIVAWVNPLGQIKFALPPYSTIERHWCVNNPSWQECGCRRWFDLESGGPWGRRHTPAHHPAVHFRRARSPSLEGSRRTSKGGRSSEGRRISRRSSQACPRGAFYDGTDTDMTARRVSEVRLKPGVVAWSLPRKSHHWCDRSDGRRTV